MKNLKKLLSAIITIAMLVAVMPSAMAATYTNEYDAYLNNGWNASYGASRVQSDTEFICVTDEMAKSGEHSLLIHDGLKGATAPLSVSHDVISTPAGEYTLSLWIAGVNSVSSRTMISMSKGVVFENTTVPQQVNMLQGTLVKTDGDWKNYTFKLSIAEDIAKNTITFMRQGCGDGYSGTYFDDISLKDEDGNEFLVNGSFDDNGKPKWTDAHSDYFYGWTEDYWGMPQTEDTFMCVTDSKAKNGAHSMFIYNTLPQNQTSATRIIQSGIATPAGEYTFSAWFAGTYSTWRTMIQLDSASPTQVNIGGCTKGETVGEWTKYTCTFTVPVDKKSTSLYIMRQGDSNGFYVDGISLKDSKGNELVANGDFEYNGKYTDNYAKYSNEWTIDYNGATQSDDVFMCVTNGMAKSGEHSMFIYNSAPSAEAKATRIVQKGFAAPAGKYYLSFWTVGDHSSWRSMILFDGGSRKQIGVSDCTKVESIGRWSKYTYEFTVEEGKTNTALYFMREGLSNGVYFDDISLKDAKGNELIENGGFEDDGVIEYTTEYEEYLGGWGITYDEGVQSDNEFVCVTNEKSRSGEYSVLIKNTVTSEAEAIGIYQDGFVASAGEYKLTFWLSGEYSGWKTMASLSGGKHVGCNLDECTVVDTAGRWTKYEYTFVVEEGNTNTSLYIIREGSSNAMYIDDISLTDANGNELLANGGFEVKGDLDACINPVVYPTSEGNAITLSWVNPAKAYDEIKIYFDGELQTGVEVEEITTAANKFNQFYYSGIENYTEHTVGLEAIRGGEIVYSCELPVWTDDLGMATSYAGNQYLGAWKYVRMENTDHGYANTVASVDYEEKASGESSIKMTGNIEKLKHQVYPNIQQKVTLDRGIKYVLSFKAKLNNVGSLFVVLETSDIGEKFWEREYIVSNTTSSDWKTYTVPLVFENEDGDKNYDRMYEDELYSANIMIAVEKMLGSINIDDVRIYSVKANDTTYTPIDPSENLIANGGFEFGGYTIETAKFELVDGAKPVTLKAIQSGNIKVTSALRNSSMGDNFSAATMIAVYNNGKLVSLPYVLERNYTESSVYLPTDKFSATVTIPEMAEDDNYEIKVMYWDGLSTFVPLDTADFLN